MNAPMLIALFLLFFQSAINVTAQDEDLKTLRKALIKRYSFDNNSQMKFVRTSMNFGDEKQNDTLVIWIFSEKPMGPMVRYGRRMIIQTNRDIFLVYSIDSLYTKTKDGNLYSNKAIKGNYSYLDFENKGNPFYNPWMFFNNIQKCENVKLDDSLESGLIQLNYTDRSKQIEAKHTYVINKDDSTVLSYMVIETQLEYGNFSSYHYQYLDESKDVENCSYTALSDSILNNARRAKFETTKIGLDTGNYFPEYKLISPNNDTLILADFNAKYYLVDFWYIGCKPCMDAIPSIIEISNDFHEVKVIGLNPFNTNLFDIKEYGRKRDISYDLFYNPDFGNDYQIGYPTFMVLDQKMKILFVKEGFSPGKVIELRSFLESLGQ